jgi:hypothetical protein
MHAAAKLLTLLEAMSSRLKLYRDETVAGANVYTGRGMCSRVNSVALRVFLSRPGAAGGSFAVLLH